MSGSFRFFVIAALLVAAFFFLYPTIKWYTAISQKDKDLVELNVTELVKRGYGIKKINEIRDLKKFKSSVVSMGLDIQGGIHVVLEVDFASYAEHLGETLETLSEEDKKEAVDRVLQKIRIRIDEFGLSDINIRKQGEDRITIQLPGAKDAKRIHDIITTQGVLDFRLVDDEMTAVLDVDPKTFDVLNTNEIPENREIAYTYIKDQLGQRQRNRPIVLENEVLMDGEHIRSASMGYGDMNEYIVRFELDNRGAELFSEITYSNVNRRLAILLDGRVQSFPSIREHIAGGSGVISGGFSSDEARDLALILKTGVMPVQVEIIAEEIIGPAMGMNLLKRSLNALMWGLILVIIFIIIYYRLSGVIASFALILNGVLIFSVLAPLRFTVTLPGIAGLILTMGMAIDANVIIFERIKEEYFTERKTIFEAIDRGYGKAFWTIFDSNITTLIAAFILSTYGTGPIKGFAITLFIGIIVSLFTSLFLSRFIYILLIKMNVIKKYSKLII